MKVKTAREILARAKKDDIIDYEIPDAESEVLEKASEVVELAEDAWATHVRGAEVEAILKLAAADANGDAPENSEGDGEESGVKVTGAFTNLPAKFSKSEPWEGYGEATVQEITEGIIWFGENEADSILDVLKNVWAYESAHKSRKKVMDFTKEAYVKFGGELGEEAEADSEGEEPVGESEESQGEEEGDSGDDGVGSESGELSGEEEIEPEASGDDGQQSDATDDSEPEASAKSGEGKSGKTEPDAKDKSSGSDSGKGSQSAEAKLVALVDKELARERVDGIPNPPKDKAPELPWNWNDVSDSALHDLHMQYASLAFYKSFQRARYERIAMHCKEAADELRNKLLIDSDKYDDKGKEIKITVLDAQIAGDPHVKRWRKSQGKYERYALQAKHELESLHKLVEALSRLMTVRHEAWERTRK